MPSTQPMQMPSVVKLTMKKSSTLAVIEGGMIRFSPKMPAPCSQDQASAQVHLASSSHDAAERSGSDSRQHGLSVSWRASNKA